MKLVHYWAPLFGEPAGVSAAISQWSEHQAAAGHEVLVLGDGDPAGSQQDFGAGVRVAGLPHRGMGRLTRVPFGLSARLTGADALILHEGFTAHQHIAAAVARRRGVPYIVVPHGVCNREWWSRLRAPRTRARLEAGLLRRAHAVHLFFASERTLLRDVSPTARPFVVPTGVTMPDSTWRGAGGGALLWIGRYSLEHKGLDLLLRALGALPSAARPRLIMRGYDYLGGKAALLRLRSELDLDDYVQVGPPVAAAEKEELLLTCAGWVQPSRWESHSIALLEALSRGVPTLISDRMPIAADLRGARAAVVTGLGVDELSVALGAFGDPADAALGARGRDYVAENFAWPIVMGRWDRELARLGVGSGAQLC